MSDADEKDGTRIGGGPPARPKLGSPAAAPPAAEGSDATHPGATLPKRPSPGAPPSGSPDAEEDDGGATVLIDARPHHAPHSLQRVEPPGHTQMLYLSGASYRVGRGEGCDIPLYSPTASRHHADLTREAQGWMLIPVAGKAVLAEGVLVQGSVCLRNQMRLQLGGDEFIFHDETQQRAEPAAAGAAAPRGAAWGRWIVIVAVALAVVAAGLWWALWRLPTAP
jgi:hypothetical protein